MDNLAIFGAQYLYLILLLIALIWFFLQPRQNQKDMVAWGLVALPLMAVPSWPERFTLILDLSYRTALHHCCHTRPTTVSPQTTP